MEWISSGVEPHPADAGSKDGHTRCLVVYQRDICILAWNHHYGVWDDEHGDDYVCQASDVSHWMPLPPFPGGTDAR